MRYFDCHITPFSYFPVKSRSRSTDFLTFRRSVTSPTGPLGKNDYDFWNQHVRIYFCASFIRKLHGHVWVLPLLGKTSEAFRFIFTDREAIGKNKQKIRSHLGPVPQVSGRLCEAKPEAKSPRKIFIVDCPIIR